MASPTLRRWLRAGALLAILPLVLACSSAGEVTDAGHDGRADATSGADVRDALAEKDADSSASPDAGIPSLLELRVSASVASDASPPMTVVPEFSPGVYDYYVRCAAGANALTVSMTASAGAKSLLLQPTPSGEAKTQTLSLHVNENQAIVAAATNGVATTKYWVRCLPHDFPQLQMEVHAESGTAPPGYYLVGNYETHPDESGYAMVLDGNGVPVWYYPVTPGNYADDVDNVVDGAISFVAYPQRSAFEIHQLSPLQTTSLAPAGNPLDEHELRVLPGGDYIVLSGPTRSGFDLTGLHVGLPDGGTLALGPNSDIKDCDVLELDSMGNVVWTWIGSDHFDPAMDSTYPEAAGLADGGGLVVDVFHCNSVDVDPANGNVLVSARNMDSVFYVERPAGKVLWKMGGSSYTKDDATYVTVADPFYRQHDARLQPSWVPTCSGGTGEITLFDDETGKPHVDRGVVYQVEISRAPGDGGAPGDCGVASGDAGPARATVLWQYTGTVNSAFMGSFRILPDGSRVVDWGYRESDRITFTEIDIVGNNLIDFTFDPVAGNASYRTVKVPLADLNLDALRNAAGLPTDAGP